MTEQQKKAAIEHLTLLYQMVDITADSQGVGSRQHRRAVDTFYSACDMLRVLYGDNVEQEVRHAAVLAV